MLPPLSARAVVLPVAGDEEKIGPDRNGHMEFIVDTHSGEFSSDHSGLRTLGKRFLIRALFDNMPILDDLLGLLLGEPPAV